MFIDDAIDAHQSRRGSQFRASPRDFCLRLVSLLRDLDTVSFFGRSFAESLKYIAIVNNNGLANNFTVVHRGGLLVILNYFAYS